MNRILEKRELNGTTVLLKLEAAEIADTTALGVARCAALGAGDFASLGELNGHPADRRVFEPNMSTDQREALMHQWRRAVQRSLNWEEH